MSTPTILIRKYIHQNVHNDDYRPGIYKWIKRYWKSLSHTERGHLRKDLQNNKPIFANIPVVIRSADGTIFLDWSKPAKKINRRKHGKCISYKRYYGRASQIVANRLEIERLNKSAIKAKQKKTRKKTQEKV